MKKGAIILICGLPGAGKTTLAKKLAEDRKAIILNADEWIIEIIKSKSDVMEIDRLRNPVEELLWKLAKKLVLMETNVIIDNGFWTESERKIYLDFARKLGVKIELHYPNASPQLIFNRLKKRNENPPSGDFEIDMKKMKKWIEIFEPPSEKEKNDFDYYREYIQK